MAISLPLHTHGHPTPNKLCRTASKCLNSSQLALNDKHFYQIGHNKYLPTRSDFLKMPFVPFSIQFLSSVVTECRTNIDRARLDTPPLLDDVHFSGLHITLWIIHISYFVPLTPYLSVHHKHFEFGLLDTPLLLQYPLFRAGNLIFDQRDRGA